MSDRIKLYLVSILGISLEAALTGSDKQLARYIHVPLLTDAQSIEIAEEQACLKANRLFPKERGFQVRHVAVKPIPEEHYLGLLQFAQFGLLATNDEPVEQAVQFLCEEYSPDQEDTVILEFDKIAS